MPELYFRFGLKEIEKEKKVETRRPYSDTNIYYFERMIGRIVKAVEGSRHTFILVIGVRKQKLREMTEDEAKREGFQSLEEFKKAWKQIYGGLNLDEDVVVIEFTRYGCWRFQRSRQCVEIEGVKMPLCATPLRYRALDSDCAFCWLAPIEWCGTCAKSQRSDDTLYCKALGVVVVKRIRIPRVDEVRRSRCDLYVRRVPREIVSAARKLRKLGISEVS